MTEYKAGARKRKPTHPGAIVKRELEDLEVTPYAAAKALGISKQLLSLLVNEKAAVSSDMALRLGKYFGNGPELWMSMQADVDLWKSREKIGAEVEKIKPAKDAA